LVGSGPDRDMLVAQVESLNLATSIRFVPAMPGRQALSKGRIMVVPSRAESLPYVVLEAAAAGVPLVVTNVGGISEIYGPQSDALIPAEDAGALAAAIARTLDGGAANTASAAQLQERVSRHFSIKAMVDGVLAAYGTGLAALRQKGRR
jgi:glycosyltransferase involved in cell wall biosynthesis